MNITVAHIATMIATGFGVGVGSWLIGIFVLHVVRSFRGFVKS